MMQVRRSRGQAPVRSADDYLVGPDGTVTLLADHLADLSEPVPYIPKKRRNIWQLQITQPRVKRKELMHFSRQMSVFIRAGIPILEAIDAITEEMGNTRFKKVLRQMHEDLRAGATFADAAEAHPNVFPTYYTGILRSAEFTGNLDTVLIQLSDYIERDLEARRKVASALVYPGVVLALSVLVVVVLTAYVLPRFEKFFASLHATLPAPTRALLSVSHFFTTWWWAIAGGIAIVLLVALMSGQVAIGKRIRDAALLGTPVLGDLIQTAILERFCRILSSMVTAGVPLPDAMAVTSDATSNAVYQSRLRDAREAMMRGEGLAAPLSETGLFPAAARQMFRVGESSGSLDDQLVTAADYFDRELDYKIKRFTNFFEPAVLLFVGVVVGFVAIALVSAMYGIFRQVHL